MDATSTAVVTFGVVLGNIIIWAFFISSYANTILIYLSALSGHTAT